MSMNQTEAIDLATFEELAGMEDNFTGAPAITGGKPPDGLYICKITSSQMKRSKEKQIPMLELVLEIANGPFHGKRFFHFNQIVNDADKLGRLKGTLEKLALQLDKLTNLPSRCGELVDLVVEVQKKTTKNSTTGKEYENIYINKLLGSGDEAIPDGANEVDASEEIPF